MIIMLRYLGTFIFLLMLVSCGGGDSSSTSVSGIGLNTSNQSPAVRLQSAFVQNANNMLVQVNEGPSGFQLKPNANLLYASVTVCVPGGDKASPTECQTIDHVQIDTGSVGLRVLASKVKGLNLPLIRLSADGDPVSNAWECLPFVVGGLWGAVAGADVWMGQQLATSVSVQLIEDGIDTLAVPQSTPDCDSAANGKVMKSALDLGSNGILGIGSTTLDCGLNCRKGDYTGTFVQYYSCPQTATSSDKCSQTAISDAMQVYNPVAALPKGYNNGVVLAMPVVTNPGAATATGELIFGLDTNSSADIHSNNLVPADATKVFLGTNYDTNNDSYLYVTTQYKGVTYKRSYLDTGANGLFFPDMSSTCSPGSPWYCPASSIPSSAIISDGDFPEKNQVNVKFQIGNADVLFSTSNTAFSDLAGSSPGSSSFAWGMPFFYGKRVYLSIWLQAGAETGPWYAWTAL